MMMYAKRFFPLLLIAALLAAALGMASVGAASPAAGAGDGALPAMRAQSVAEADEEDPIPAAVNIDLAAPYDWEDPVCAGDNLRYTLTFTNTGEVALAEVILVSTIPVSTTFVAGDSSAGAQHDGAQSVQWEIGEVAPGAVVTRDLVVRVSDDISDGTVITASVQVTSDQGSTNVLSEDTTVEVCAEPTETATATATQVTPTATSSPNVTATPTATSTTFPSIVGIDLAPPLASSDPVCAGWRFRYTLTFTNTGFLPLTNVVLSDTLSERTQYIESSDGGTYDGKQTVSWKLSSVSAGQVVQRSVDLRTYSNLSSGTIVSNTVQVLSDLIDSQSKTTDTTVQRCGGPTATKTPIPPTATPTRTPTVTATATASPTPTATVKPDGRVIFLPLMVREFEH